MFDPTIFDNVKVALENHFYDLDNLDSRIEITGRYDRLEMAVMSREFGLVFMLAGQPGATAEIWLSSSLKQLAAELTAPAGEPPAGAGCSLALRFRLALSEPDNQCREIESIVRAIWGDDILLTQSVSYVFGREAASGEPAYALDAGLRFRRVIGEEQMEDIPGLADHMLLTLTRLLPLAK